MVDKSTNIIVMLIKTFLSKITHIIYRRYMKIKFSFAYPILKNKTLKI